MKEILKSKEYDFLRTDRNLGKHIIMLNVAGSHSYGTNNENSDIDLRGITMTPKSNLLGFGKFEQYEDENTDTVIYSFDKMIKMLMKCNPNVLEFLGCRPEHYLYLSDIGEELIQNRKMFLSQEAVHSFGQFADSQLRRLLNKSNTIADQEERERHMLKTMNHAFHDIKERYFKSDGELIDLYIDKAVNPKFTTEIFMDLNAERYPLRDYLGIFSELQSIIKSYDKFSKKDKDAFVADEFETLEMKVAKHMMHTARLYMEGVDLLEKEEIITYREKEHDLLMDMRNGKYLDSNIKPIQAYYDIIDEYKKRFEYASKNTSLPLTVDKDKIEEFMMEMHLKMLKR